MSDETETETQEPETLEQVRAALKREQKRSKELAESSAEANAAKRELAFLKAGVDLDSKVGQLYSKAYDGELDVDAIKAGWTDLAPAPAPATTTPEPAPTAAAEGMSAEDLARLAQSRQALQTNATPAGTELKGPLGQDMMHAAFEAQGSQVVPQQGMSDKAANAGFSVLFNRATEGDPEALFKAPEQTIRDATDRWRERNA